MNLLRIRREIAYARRHWLDLKAMEPGFTDATGAQQHEYWRARDAAKLEYATLDWRYQRALLRGLLTALAVLALISVVIDVSTLAIGTGALLGHRTYVVLTRHAPGEED